MFGRDNTYVELQNAGLDVQQRVNPELVKLAAEAKLPLVATGDVHYLTAEDAYSHEALLCIQSGDSLKNPNHWRFDTNEFYFKTPAEMALDFPGHEDAMRRTLEVAERCSIEIELGNILLPKFPTPNGRDAFEYLVELCEQGLERRYDKVTPELRERLQFELKTIREMGFADYFLIVWDFIHFAKVNGIGVGPGRGSAAGSLAAYALEITDIDPIKYDLLFERFLNPGRKSMPDIDIDFAVDGRERVINYVSEKYGRDRVAQIITFGTMAARAAVRDAGRVLEIPYGVVDRIAKLIPEGPGQTLAECLKPGSDLKTAYETDPAAKEIIDLARPLEGLVRQDSIHAAGVVIGAEPLIDTIPLQQKGADQEVVTQFSMNTVEALGLLKMDFLGLRNLDVIDKAVELVGGVDMTTIPLDDKKTYAMLARGEAMGVFQFESSGMREALRQVKPTVFEDLIALVALYRPGPMQYIPNYAKRKAGQEQVTFIDPRLKAITGSTYGISIYQEQSMEIAKQIGGFSPAEADDLRKAIGKKIHKLMASLKDKFIAGCIGNQTSEQVARQLWDDIEKSQDYSFNKSHAACYALIAYRTAWLKANHPCEYMAALISSVMSTKDRVPLYVNACDELGIEVLPPDVNTSQTDFAVVEGKIRFGLNAVKSVGESAANAIIRARDEGGAVRVDLGLHRARRPAGREQALARGARQVRRARLHRRLADGDAGAARAGARVRAEARRRPARRAGVDLRHGRHGGVGRAEAPPRDPDRRVREAGAPEAGEGDARALRLRAPAPRRPRAAPPQDRLHAERAGAPARRRGRLCRRDRLVGEAADDEEGRADGLPDPRRPDRRRRGGRLQLDLRAGARALRRRPDPRDQGPRRPQAAGRDEADRDRGERLRGGAGAHRDQVQARRPRRPGRPDPRPRAPGQGLPRPLARARRPGDVDGAEDAGARAWLHGRDRHGLPHRGPHAPGRRRDRLEGTPGSHSETAPLGAASSSPVRRRPGLSARAGEPS